MEVDVLELNQTGRAGPFSVALAAVMLKSDRALVGDPGQLGLVQNRLAVQHDSYAVSHQRDLEPVPLAHGIVGLRARRDPGSNLRG